MTIAENVFNCYPEICNSSRLSNKIRIELVEHHFLWKNTVSTCGMNFAISFHSFNLDTCSIINSYKNSQRCFLFRWTFTIFWYLILITFFMAALETLTISQYVKFRHHYHWKNTIVKIYSYFI